MQMLSQDISPWFLNLFNSCAQQVSIQISPILGFFSNILINYMYMLALKQTRIHLTVKPTKTRTNLQPGSVLFFHISHGRTHSSAASKLNSDVKPALQPVSYP